MFRTVVLTVLAIASLSTLSQNALAAKSNSEAILPLVYVKCASTYEGSATLRVSGSKKAYVDVMILSLNLPQLANDSLFVVKSAQVTFNDIAIRAMSPSGAVVELDWTGNISDDTAPAPATLKVNGQAVDFLKFECSAGFAG